MAWVNRDVVLDLHVGEALADDNFKDVADLYPVVAHKSTAGVIVLEILEDEPIAVTGDNPLTEMVEIDLVIFGIRADLVGLLLFVDKPITGMDKPLDKVDELDFLTIGLDIVIKVVTGVICILRSFVVRDFMGAKTFAVAVDPNGWDLYLVVVKISVELIVLDLIDKGPADTVVEKPGKVTKAGPVMDAEPMDDVRLLLVEPAATDVTELWLVVEAEVLVEKPPVESLENDSVADTPEVPLSVEELEATVDEL